MPTPSHPAPRPRRGPMQRLWGMPVLLLVAASLFWAGNFVIGRAVHGIVPPFFLAFWRWMLALLLLLPFAWPHLRRDAPALFRQWPLMLLLGLLGIAVFSTFVYLGLRSTTAVNGALLQSVIPLAILACSFLVFGEAPRPRQLLGLALSLAGVVCIASHGSLEDLLGLRLRAGDLWIMGAVLAYAIYSACLRLRPRVHPLSFLFCAVAASLLALLPAWLWEAAARPLPPLGAATLLSVGYLAVFPSLLSYLFFNRGVELIGANRAGQFIHLLPVFGSLMAVVFLGEALELFHLAGLALIGGGILLAMRAR
ncbi:DMT family transporter [Teichococcus vastitatis]|uniref:DMT family transporter n=1 Tax=Teichococcus vastitatis TaxID=2307076 RepID=A0ABS9VZN9_9PROT|nr:DMT family transporter [Pseudoroseomonas vastitatis]MCI0752496.1 DMT family transporter [Pseudoroseomonas vastitatis]